MGFDIFYCKNQHQNENPSWEVLGKAQQFD